jgi:hypothetical protein
MKSRVVSFAAIIVLSAASVFAADVAGKWTAKVPAGQGAQGESTVTLVFKVDGSNVTGTINNSQQPGDVEIKDGKVTGDDISFSLTRKIGETDLKVVWKGKVSGDEIKFTRAIEGAGGAAGGPGGGAATEITATRVK